MSTWLPLRSQHKKRAGEDFGQNPSSLSMRYMHWRRQRGSRKRGVTTGIACIHQTSCSTHGSTFTPCPLLSGSSQPHKHIAQLIWLHPVETTGITMSAASWVDMNHTGLPDTWSSWTDTVDLLKALLDCKRIPLTGDAEELNVTKCCLKTGIHTFMCALTACPSGRKETAQLPIVDSALPTATAESLMNGLMFWQQKVRLWHTLLSCKAQDTHGFIPVWEVKAPSILFLTWRTSYLAA